MSAEEPTEFEKFLFDEVQRQKKRIKRLEHKAKVANEMIDDYRDVARKTMQYVSSIANIPTDIVQDLQSSLAAAQRVEKSIQQALTRTAMHQVNNPKPVLPPLVLNPQAVRKNAKAKLYAPKPKPAKVVIDTTEEEAETV